MLYKILSCPFFKEIINPGVDAVSQACQLDKNKNIRTDCLIKIRTAHSNDLKGLVEVLSRSFYASQTTVLGLQPLLRLGMYEDMRVRLRSDKPNYRCLVAYQAESIIGTVEIALRNQIMTKQIPYLSNLAVVPEYRRKGVARQLLYKCDQIALEWGFDELSLHVLDNNLTAQQLYFNCGYKLQKVEHSLNSWLFHQPKRLFLAKHLENRYSSGD